ncbi:hypothetical protein CLAFUW4_06663 [Fulvia fulva]|uniref:Flavin reductase like domain-containing protein n=1 Tax=Passalora fulva TaxID=5499 RepID=A0A9Q8PAN5_PASFU|nr:uncharacterized protein CLAFUR5_06807 [Fulvia fulva]KAK4621221.1 hypothetical protein CLAFUR4_06671 [Fulvia fulva]KAK4622885.1 hypothetical protein CLAFUR0_06665 [Fulvia fulva]UJO18947.1 hypothetical protein CLAFUR5_06807 [Fulvia fulva]WPV15715.1 hypothetical protein CLAFUW4_06663 [Fulvia fulva]WPV31067.1 hypothetical protein CLAFUW7_06662 [Fulvia fulva]
MAPELGMPSQQPSRDAAPLRQAWDESSKFRMNQTRNPDWKFGSGASDGGLCLEKSHVEIDPHEPGREVRSRNYKLLVSGIVPRPIGLISTESKDGSCKNLAPMSYTQVVNHDPPVFVIGFAGGLERMKDTLKNLIESAECVINIVSEHFVEAANATSVNTPYGVSEWDVSGLTPETCAVVKPSRVKESVFSIEGKLLETKAFESLAHPGKKEGVMAIVQGVRFWAREDAINAEKTMIDPSILCPVARMGGNTYARVTEGFELDRPIVGKHVTSEDIASLAAGR